LKRHELLVHYYQVTLGPAHETRVRALDATKGVRCIGVALASRERTRSYPQPPRDRRFVTIRDGVYEDARRIAILRAACKHLRRSLPDVVIVDSLADWVQIGIAVYAHRLGIRVFPRWASIATDHVRYAWKEWIKSFVYRRWDGYLATGKLARDYARSFGIPDERIFLCGNPVDGRAIEAARSAAPDRPRERSFLYVGRFLPYKNLDGLMRAFLDYRRDGGAWRLDLVGLGPCEPDLRALVQGDSSVCFVGPLGFSELINRYLSAGFLVLPSHSEPWGLVVNEALHAGLPVAVSRHCGCVPELVVPGQTGYLFDPEDQEDIARVLWQIETLGSESRRAMSRAANEQVRGQTPADWAERVALALGAPQRG